MGERVHIAATRAMVRAALAGEVNSMNKRNDPTFGFEVALAVRGVADALLSPRKQWRDHAAYERKGAELARLFSENFRQFAGDVSPAVRAAGPT